MVYQISPTEFEAGSPIRMLTDDNCDKLLHGTTSIPNLLHLEMAVYSGDACNPAEPAIGLPGKPELFLDTIVSLAARYGGMAGTV